MRLLLLLLLAGCDPQLCDRFDGQTCISLEVKGTPTVDQLGISIDGLLSRQLTPNPRRETPVALPVWVAVLPGEDFPLDQPLRIFVDALRDGALVGQALGELQMRPGTHISAAISLTDLTSLPDLAGVDLAGADLRSGADLAGNPTPAFFPANNGLFGGEITAILADFSSGAAYAGTSGAGVFKTSDSGGTWAPANKGLDAIAIAALASDDIIGTIYATGLREDGTGALYKSGNPAVGWTHVIDLTSVGPVLPTIDSLANPVLFVGLPDGGGILRSTDGINFTAKNVGLTDPQVISLVADPLTKGTIYAGTRSDKVFQTTNFGDSWSSVSSGLPTGSDGVGALKFDPHTQDLVAATGQGLFVRLFGMSSFSAYTPTPPLTNVRAFDFVQSATPDFYVADASAGVFHLDGNKTAWNNASAGLTDKSMMAIELDRTNSGLLYAGTQFGGMFVSTNAATSWAPANFGIKNLSVLKVEVFPGNPQIVYAGSQHAGLFKSTNAGMSWTAINNGLPVGAGISAIAINSLTSGTVFVATQDTGGLGIAEGVFRTLDGGSSWVQVDSNATLSLLLADSNLATVYAGTTSGTVRKSFNNGDTFFNAGSAPSAVSSLVVDPSNKQILYAGTVGSGVVKSGDGGSTWNPASSGISETQINSLEIDPFTPTRLWAAGFNSVYRSTDAAGSWQQAASGLSGHGFSRIARTLGNVLYTVSSNGAFRSDDLAVSWSHLAGSHAASDLALESGDPDLVYFAHIGLVGVTKTVTGGR